MNPTINTGPGFASMRPEDRIRALLASGVNDNSARQASDVQDFVNQVGFGQGPEYATALANHLKSRGHAVNYNFNS